LVSKEAIQDCQGLSDRELARAICMGLAVLVRIGASSESVLEFLEGMVNTIRLAEAGRVPVRDEGAN
jgi:hypothetical protein